MTAPVFDFLRALRNLQFALSMMSSSNLGVSVRAKALPAWGTRRLWKWKIQGMKEVTWVPSWMSKWKMTHMRWIHVRQSSLKQIASDLQDYTRSALEALGEAMQLDASDDEPPVAPVHVPVVTPSVGETRADAVEMPSPKPPSKKEFQPLTMPQSVEEVEARIKYLECFDCTYGLRSNNHQV